MSSITYFPMDKGPIQPAINVMGGWIITSYFGGRIDPIKGGAGNHGGMDFAYFGCHGDPFYAVISGKIWQSTDSTGGGLWTSLQGDNGDYFGYGHALKFAPGKNGRHVEAGELLGWVDSTGGSTGSHMHLAYRPRGASGYRDPYDILKEAADNNRYVGVVPPVTGGEDDEVTLDELQQELKNQDARTKAYIDFKEEETRLWLADRIKEVSDAVYNSTTIQTADLSTFIADRTKEVLNDKD